MHRMCRQHAVAGVQSASKQQQERERTLPPARRVPAAGCRLRYACLYQ